MNYKIYEGNYAKMGVEILQNQVVFTFEGEKEDSCCVVLVNKKTREKSVVEVPTEFCLGSLRSISIVDIDIKNYYYYFEINGVKKNDPYATRIIGREKWNNRKRIENDYQVYCACDVNDFDWENDTYPEISKQDMMIYKMHVRGFSKDYRGLKNAAGTFRGVIERINYLKMLGFTSVELMPVYEFEEIDVPPVTSLPSYIKWKVEEADQIIPVEKNEAPSRINYWGYGAGDYFSVKASYASKPEYASIEFKELVKKLHANSMECIMEIFFDKGTNHNLIIDALRYWVREFHVDGFHILGEEIPITAIVQDVMLSRTKILYSEFEENNLPYRGKYKTLFLYKEEYMYPTRKILNHMNGSMRDFLNQQRKQGEELGYINYITSNNGFTLSDLFMYNDRHNEDNGEDNLDGNSWNFSNNYGVEGPTKKKFIDSIRKLKWRNAMMMIFLGQGVPMLWSGDEIGNSQKGNNNAYCQDNKIGWTNWKKDKASTEQLDFLSRLIDFRKKHPIISNGHPFRFNDYKAYGYPDVSYHGDNAWISDLELDRSCIGLMYCGEYSPIEEEKEYVYIGYNFFSGRNMLALPTLKNGMKWYKVADSSKISNQFEDEYVELEEQHCVQMEPQAICILVGK